MLGCRAVTLEENRLSFGFVSLDVQVKGLAMTRTALCPLMFWLCCCVAQAARGPELIDPEEARADPDFAVQGEYVGEGVFPDGGRSKAGAQAIAQGDGKFRLVVYRGGLPGAGWQRGGERFFLDGRREGDVTRLASEKLAGKIEGEKLTVTDPEGKPLMDLKRAQRKSPTLGEKPPAGAVVLFDGSSAEHFQDGKITPMKTLEAGTTTKSKFAMAKLHLEFRLSWRPEARGQGRSNSGIYISGIPEIQVLDSFGLEGRSNECGGFYGRREPDVNMCLPPLVWQTFDVEFLPPQRDADGKPTENIRVTVRHNGVVIHENYDTGRRESPPRGIHLQRHGNRVQYGNVWLVERK